MLQAPSRYRPVFQRVGRADQSQMREGLWKVTEMFAFGAKFLRVKSNVVGVAQHLFENKTSHWSIARASKAFRVPEGAHAEGSFLPRQAVGRGVTKPIPMDERILDQFTFNSLERGEPAPIRVK